jgi:hypothetical protein
MPYTVASVAQNSGMQNSSGCNYRRRCLPTCCITLLLLLLLLVGLRQERNTCVSDMPDIVLLLSCINASCCDTSAASCSITQACFVGS